MTELQTAPTDAGATRPPHDADPAPTFEAAPAKSASGIGVAAEPARPATVHWTPPSRSPSAAKWPMPPLLTVLGRGFVGRCPSCGKTRLFRGYLRVVDACAVCGAPLGQARADDAPPYFTIFVVGHVVVLLMVMAENRWTYSLWVSAAIWLPVTLVLSLLLLRPIKGATVGLMLRLGLMKSAAGE